MKRAYPRTTNPKWSERRSGFVVFTPPRVYEVSGAVFAISNLDSGTRRAARARKYERYLSATRQR